MDNVLVNFQSGLDKIDLQTQSKFDDKNDEIPGIFSLMEPVEGAIEAFENLSAFYGTKILSPHLGRIRQLGQTSFYGSKNIWGIKQKSVLSSATIRI